MTVLVTGATGFIGRRLLRRLLDLHGAGAIVCLVKAPATPLEVEALELYRSRGIRLVEGDLTRQPVSTEAPPHDQGCRFLHATAGARRSGPRRCPAIALPRAR